MANANESRYFKLGLFVIVGVTLIVAGVIVFGAGALFIDYVTVETATMESVQGLDVGTPVKYMGVTIGKISKIELAAWNHQDKDPARQAQIAKFVEVEMAIRRDMVPVDSAAGIHNALAHRVEQGLRVRMASSGLTGPPYLEVTYLDPHDYPAVALPWKPDHPYVPSAASSLAQIVTSIEDVMMQLKRADLGQVVGHVDKLIVNTDKAIAQLEVATLRERAVALVDEVRGTNARVKQILDDPRVDKTIGDLSEAVAGGKAILAGPEAKALVADLPRISADLRDTAKRIDEIMHDPKLQKAIDGVSETAGNAAVASADLKRVMRQLDVLMTTQRQDLESIVFNLRRIVENGSALVEDAKSNPSRAIFGEPPPRVRIGATK